jgi:bacillopeptidase F
MTGFVTTLPTQTFQDNSPVVSYNGWQGVTDPVANGGSYRQKSAAGGNASFKFSGTSVKWATVKGPDKGVAKILIDGKAKPNVDLYSPVETPSVQTFSGLASASHTLQIQSTGTKNNLSTGSSVPVDALIVGSSTTQDSSNKITYGPWAGKSSTSASGGNYRSGQKSGDTTSFTFAGTSVDWITTVGKSYGKAEIYLDGADLGPVDLYSSANHWQTVKTYAASGAGSHTVQVKALGTKRSASTGTTVIVDAFVVHP